MQLPEPPSEVEGLRQRVAWLEAELMNLKQRNTLSINGVPFQSSVAAGCGYFPQQFYPGYWVEIAPAGSTGITPEWQRNAIAGTAPQ